MPIIYDILFEISTADENNAEVLSSLRLKLARTMAVDLSNEIARVDREFSAKYVEIKNAKREAGFKATNDELEESRGETDIAQKRTELLRLWRGCDATLEALQQRIQVIQSIKRIGEIC